MLTVSAFAWTSSQARVQRALLGSAAARANLARQVVAAVRDRGADGVNLDFEPLASGYGDEFVSLLRTLRSEFNKVRSGYQITYDTTAYIGNYPLEASVGRRAADAIFVMGYDYRIGSSSTAGSIDPLSGPGYDLADTVRAYKARVPGSRIILGVPWYGRAWSTATSSPRSRTISGLKYGYSTPVNYENVLAFAAKYGRRWDPVEQSPYVVYRRRNCTSTYGCVTSWRQIWYDDAASLRRRYQLVNDYGLRGAACGRSATTAATASSTVRSPRRSSWTSPPRRPASGRSRPSRATRASSSDGRARTSAGSSRTTSRCRSTAAAGRRGARGRRRPRTCSWGARRRAMRSGCGRRTARATSAHGTSRRRGWRRPASAAASGVSPATGFPTAPGRAPGPRDSARSRRGRSWR